MRRFQRYAIHVPPSDFLRALTAFARDTPACVITSSMSLGSRPVSSGTSPSSSSAAAEAEGAAAAAEPIRMHKKWCSQEVRGGDG